MKITDFCLIFIAITLPLIIVVYINVSFTIKAEEQEMYYMSLINSAIEDATTEMKQVENEDVSIDYGYSGESDKKVSVNAEIGKNAFFNALYNNFGIKGNDAAQRYLQLFIPALLIIDYNGVYVSSIEEFKTLDDKGNEVTITEHAVKPKKNFTYTYYVLDQKDSDGTFKVVPASLYQVSDGKITSAHTVEFTMDDYIYHRGTIYANRTNTPIDLKTFYLSDTRVGTLVVGETMTTVNNSDLYIKNNNLSDTQNVKMINKIAQHLKDIKSSVIIETLTNELAYSVNANNYYAASAGVTYDFVFPPMEQEQMGEYINDIGILAFIQGLSVGNKYLDTRAYSTSRLELVNRYYLSVAATNSKFNMNLYHMSRACPEYKVSTTTNITPSYVITKQQAASAIASYGDSGTKKALGFYPCPVCNP